MKTCPQCQTEYPESVDFCPADGTKLRARKETAADPLIGRALDGRWVIEEKLGEGGMGAVYKGHQKSVSRTVAIKTLRPQLVDSEEFVDRFFREAKIAATISHPNSVTILDYGESEGTLFLAMEFLDGELLTDRIERGGLTIKQVLEIGIQVSSALAAAHQNNIVHRDLKPDNIFLLDVPGGATFIKVLDFGIAKMLDSKTQVTKTGMIFGTPEYMSPEQCRGDKIDGRSDLYSLGCILYELVGGRTPFRGTTPMAVLMAHVNEAAPTLADNGTSHVPYAVDQIIMRLLEKRPDDRFPSAAELQKTLEAVLGSLDNPSAAAALVTPVPSREIVGDAVNIGFEATMGIAPAGTPEVDARRERTSTDALDPPEPAGRGKLVAILAVLVLTIVAAIGVIVSKSGSQATDAAAQAPPVATAPEPEPTTPPTLAATAEPTPTDAPPEAVVAPDAGAKAEPPAEEVAVAAPAKKKTRKTAKQEPAPAQAEPEPEPQPEPEPKVAETPPAPSEPVATKTPETAPKTAEQPPKKKKKGIDKLNDTVEKGVRKTLNKALDGLMD